MRFDRFVESVQRPPERARRDVDPRFKPGINDVTQHDAFELVRVVEQGSCDSNGWPLPVCHRRTVRRLKRDVKPRGCAWRHAAASIAESFHDAGGPSDPSNPFCPLQARRLFEGGGVSQALGDRRESARTCANLKNADPDEAPSQGRWPIGGLGLSADTVVQLYGGNARRLGLAPPLASAP